MASDEEITRMYQALGSSLRRRIIEFLGTRGKARVTEIKKALKVSTGSLYYNLELLRDLIDRDENKKYYLTEKGWIAYNL
ncbi:MAG: winged helix-turn-helix domain-containing protein, partial [archaeon GB-1867-035]|nr:winged helix-turn-helix domain-containing protein [Candidatus Culexmicrobium profundum]